MNAHEPPEHMGHPADEPQGETSQKLANHASGQTCPQCHGSLWERDDARGLRYECRVGHAFRSEALLAGQSDAVEAALWSAINTLQERAAALRRLHASARASSNPDYVQRAEASERDAEALLGLLRRLTSEGG